METTIFCVDNSEWMRNGDFIPSRLVAQREAAYDAGKAKLMAHPENLVGVVSMAGGSARVVVNLTANEGTVYTRLVGVEEDGVCDFVAGLKVAQLALKHRPNPIQRQRILLFVGSPISAPTQTLVKAAKALKKNKVAVDVLSFGETEANAEKLDAFIAAVHSGSAESGSSLVTVPHGSSLRDALFSSPIMGGASSGPAPMDDDIAQAIALSLAEAGAAPGGAPGSDTASGGAPPPSLGGDIGFLTEEEQIERALAMSLQQDMGGDQPSSTSTESSASQGGEGGEGGDLQSALEDDPGMLDAIIADLPGVDADTFRAILDAQNEGQGEGGEGEGEGEE